MTALASVRRRRTAFMLGANVLVIAAVGVLLVTGVTALRQYTGAKNTVKPLVKVPVTPVGMLATVDGNNSLTSVTVFVLKPDTMLGGSIVSVPISADSVAGADGRRVPLTEAYATGGAEALSVAVESTLSITINQSAVVNAEQLTSLLQPVSPFAATFPLEVQTTDNGQTVSLFPKGANTLAAVDAVAALNARTRQQNERSRRPTLEAVWAGVAAAVAQGRTHATAGVTPTSLSDLVNRLFAGPIESRGLLANRLPSGQSNGKDVEELDRAEAVMVFGIVAPGNMSAPATGLVWRIEAPSGHDAQVKYAVELILYLGGNVQSVYLEGPAQVQTNMILYDPRFDQATTAAQKVFGDVKLGTPDQRIEGVDVVLQLGSSFLDANSGTDNTMPATTSTTAG